MNFMKDLKGKKLLILGGFYQHKKVVEACRKLGVISYVTDFLPLEKAPAKKIADHYYFYNIDQIEEIVELCVKEKIDGAICSHSESCTKAYQEICTRMGYYCFGNKKQYEILTNKENFIKFCTENNISIIRQYDENDVINKKIEYPVFVKPSSSNGSKGQSICYSEDEIREAISFAKSNGRTNDIIIEKYFENGNDFSISYLIVNGTCYLVRTNDRFLCAGSSDLKNSAVITISPSRFTNQYLKNTNKKFSDALTRLGLINCPCFFQGFIDETDTFFYDPGLRFPGGEYDRLFESSTGINLVYPLIEYSLTGSISHEFKFQSDVFLLNGHYVANLFIPLKSGKIDKISGFNEINKLDNIISIFINYSEGDIVPDVCDSRRRLCEIAICSKTIEELKNTIDRVYSLIVVTSNGLDMIDYRFNTNLLCLYEK